MYVIGVFVFLTIHSKSGLYYGSFLLQAACNGMVHLRWNLILYACFVINSIEPGKPAILAVQKPSSNVLQGL